MMETDDFNLVPMLGKWEVDSVPIVPNESKFSDC